MPEKTIKERPVAVRVNARVDGSVAAPEPLVPAPSFNPETLIQEALSSDVSDLALSLHPGEIPEGPAERRKEIRYACHDAVQVRVLPGDGRMVSGTMIDISKSGVRVEIPIPAVKGSEIEVMIPQEMIIFGEVRHSRRSGETYLVGVMIRDVFYARQQEGMHVHTDQLSRYLAGKGLSAPEAISVRQHLQYCRYCRSRLADPDVLPKR